MEHQKISNLLNEASKSTFVTRKWFTVNDLSNANYNVGNEIIYSREVLKSNLCYFSDTYVLIRGNITAAAAHTTQVAFKNYAPFTKCITKIDETTVDDAEYLRIGHPDI